MKIKANKQRAFNTSTMTSSSNYNANKDTEFAEEIGAVGKPKEKDTQKMWINKLSGGI
ncbi:hypothetical protein JCM14036_34850 [Desulfotomaculum defluvii]